MKNRAYILFWHKIVEAAYLIFSLAAMIIYIIFAASTKGEIATHFAFDGTPDAYGSAWEGLAFPITMLITNIALSAMVHFLPVQSWNMPGQVTERNAPFRYRNAISMVVLIGLCVSLMSLLGTIFMFKARALMGPVTIGLCVIMTVIIILYSVKTYRDSKRYA
ncbi:MAG: DUF1648 domain-containing protein [Lachnospiraceae bacterium]|nr:DUF1648 domain-containing protein [Lachnospiraceae bacterium]